MATRKQARYVFKLKEAPPRMVEVREGVLEPVSDRLLVMEPVGEVPASERPLSELELGSFALVPGISFEDAAQIADFLNRNLLEFAVARFGDAEDAARELERSRRIRQRIIGGPQPDPSVIRAYRQPFAIAFAELKDALTADDLPRAKEAIREAEIWAAQTLDGWARALELSQGILDAFSGRSVHGA